MNAQHETPEPEVLTALVTQLVARWRAEASNLRGWGAHGHANAVERCAAQLHALLTDDTPNTGGVHG